eukprot:gene6987-9548_t
MKSICMSSAATGIINSNIFYHKYLLNISGPARNKFSYKPLTSIPEHNTVINISGVTFVPNCFYVGSYNPAHLLFGYVTLFEWSTERKLSSDLPKIDYISTKLCASVFSMFRWEWGHIILKTIFSEWINSSLWSSLSEPTDSIVNNYTVNKHNYIEKSDRIYDYFNTDSSIQNRFISASNHNQAERMEKNTIFCYDYLLFTQRWGVLFQSNDILLKFQQKLKENFPIQKSFDTFHSNEELMQRCKTNQLRIKYQYVTANKRRVINTHDMYAILHNFSSDVSNFTVDALTPFHIQRELYNNFDILITPPGSHLTNMILVENYRENVAIIELATVMRDEFWRKNAIEFKFSSYIISDGHSPHINATVVNKHFEDLIHNNHECEAATNSSHGIYCSNTKIAWKISDSNFIINETIFQQDVREVIDHLCFKVL